MNCRVAKTKVEALNLMMDGHGVGYMREDWKILPYKDTDKRIVVQAGEHKIYVDADDVPFNDAVDLAKRIAKLPDVESELSWTVNPERMGR